MASMDTGDYGRGGRGGRGRSGGYQGRGGGYQGGGRSGGGGGYQSGGGGGGYQGSGRSGGGGGYQGGGYNGGGGGYQGGGYNSGGGGGNRGGYGRGGGYNDGGDGGGGGGGGRGYNQNFGSTGRGRGRNYWGGRGGGRGRGRGRFGDTDRQEAAQREPPPTDLEFVAELKGHSKKVTTVLMDEAGGQLFTGSHDGTVRVWSCTTGQCVSTVPVSGEVSCMLISSGFLFVGLKTASGAGQVKSWNMATNTEYPAMEGHTGAVQALAAAGDMLFSAGQDMSMRVWKLDPASNQWGCVAVLKVEQGGHRAPISCLWASHPFLFSADYLGTLKVWDLSTGALRQTIDKAHSGSDVPCITNLTVWEGHIVSASLDGLIKIWEPADPATGLILNPTPIFTFPEQEPGQRGDSPSGILSLCGVADSQNRCVLMASYNGERCIRMWELPSFEPRGTLGDVNNARAMAGSASAQLVFSGDEHGRVKVWKWKAPTVGPGGFPLQ